MKTRSRRRIADSEIHQLVRRLLRSNQPNIDIPVIVSSIEGKYFSSVGCLLQRRDGHVSVLVDQSLEPECAVKVFLPESAYVAEVVRCAPSEGRQFVVDLVLIQYQYADTDF